MFTQYFQYARTLYKIIVCCSASLVVGVSFLPDGISCFNIFDSDIDIIIKSTVVLNSRDWYEIIWLPEISRFKNQPCNRFYQLECIGKAVMMLYLG